MTAPVFIGSDGVVTVPFVSEHVPKMMVELGGFGVNGDGFLKRIPRLVNPSAIEQHRNEVAVGKFEIRLHLERTAKSNQLRWLGHSYSSQWFPQT